MTDDRSHSPTCARIDYAREESRIYGLMLFILNGAVLLKKAASFADPSQLHSALSYQDQITVDDAEVDIDPHRPLIAEMLLCRSVDNFLTYVVDLLTLLYATRPEMMRSGEQIGIDIVLQHSDIDSLRRAIAERRIERLSYLGMRDLVKYLRDQHGFDLIPHEADLERAVLLVEIRNLIIHNRGIVNRIAASKSPLLAGHIGKQVPLLYEEVKGHRAFLWQQVTRIDLAAVDKFTLPIVAPAT